MGSKSQRRKEQHSRKRQEKRRKQERSRARRVERQRKTGDVNSRHRERLAKQVPVAWPGELLEDVAVFDDATLATLSPELAEQVAAVREALEDVSASRRAEALNRVASIARGSPLSEWRLLIRGLADWLTDDANAASETWKRLDPQRRPGRMAAAMMLATRSDLDQLSAAATPEQQDAESPPAQWHRGDGQLLDHARLVRRIRFDRPALRVAESGLRAAEEDKELLIGPSKIGWLRKFIANYRETEPELVAALAQAALARAYVQNFSDLFEEAIKSFPGPRHDLGNRLLTYHFFSPIENRSAQQKARAALDMYLHRELPQNTAISPRLRSAIASQIHFRQAGAMLAEVYEAHQFGPMGMFFGPQENTTGIRQQLKAALQADPANGPVYKAYVGWIQSKLDDERLEKSLQTPLETELEGVMRRWSQAQPDEVEPRLWLVDALLEQEKLDEARPHVEFLAASRQDDPRVRAMPWKWQLLEAMRLCRRKASLPDARARLEEGEALWPAWLSKQWLPYLWAAWASRSGQKEVYEAQRERICRESGIARDSLADACMMLGAAQRMRVAAADLKPFRAAVDQALAGLKTLPLDDLIHAGSFFWDLQRAQLLYPAYRMHAKKIGLAFVSRLNESETLVLNRIDDERLQAAVLWGSENRFWPNNYETKFPAVFANPIIGQHPAFAAARANAFLKQRYAWGADKQRDLTPLLREAAATQRDPYYRYWYLSLADQLEESLDKYARTVGFAKTLFGMDSDGDDDYDEDDDDFDEDDFDEDDEFAEDEFDLGFDPNCNCSSCRAARRAYEKGQPRGRSPY